MCTNTVAHTPHCALSDTATHTPHCALSDTATHTHRTVHCDPRWTAPEVFRNGLGCPKAGTRMIVFVVPSRAIHFIIVVWFHSYFRLTVCCLVRALNFQSSRIMVVFDSYTHRREHLRREVRRLLVLHVPVRALDGKSPLRRAVRHRGWASG